MSDMPDMPDFNLGNVTRIYAVQSDMSNLSDAQKAHARNFMLLLEGDNLPALAKATEHTVAHLEAMPFLAIPLLLAGQRLAKDSEFTPVAIDAAIKAHAFLPEPRLELQAATVLLGIAQDPAYPKDRQAGLAATAAYLVPSDERITNLMLAQTPPDQSIKRSQIKLGFDPESTFFRDYAQRLTALATTIVRRPLLQDKATPPNPPGTSSTP
ncbi:MAG: hypothetical protein WBK91_05795 [Alphaproteobacteria bacterium]